METALGVRAGFMGIGIAQVCTQASYQVYLMDTGEITTL